MGYYIDRISQIETQVLKNLTYTPTDEQYVLMAQSYLKALVSAAEANGEDLSLLPGIVTTFLGCTITWDGSNPEGDSFTVELNGISVYQDADDPIQPLGSGPPGGGVLDWSTAAESKIVAPDAEGGDLFGYSVSISGDYAIVGAYGEEAGGDIAGAAYIFYNDGTGWDTGTKIVAPDAQAFDSFGCSVSISGDYAIVGAQGDDDGGSDAGAAYIFNRTGLNTWDEGTKIVAHDAEGNDFFGYSVSISGDYAIVGASARYKYTGGNSAGAAYIFYNDGTGWDAGTKIVAPDAQAFDRFGASVSISGDYAIVGAWGEDVGGSDAGAAYIFNRTGLNTWDAGTKIVAPDAEAVDSFGCSVSISGDYAIVGAWGEDDGGSNAGAAYIFYNDGTGWDEGTKIVAPDAQAGDRFGYSVSISGDYAIVGASNEDTGGGDAGAAYIFNRTGLNTWDAGTKIVAHDAQAGDRFGASVSISGDYAIVGAQAEDDGGDSAGAAYIFNRT